MMPAIMIVSSFVIRIRLEEKTLPQKLPGYGQYAARIRYDFYHGYCDSQVNAMFTLFSPSLPP